jgi:hypothetical protein
VALPIEKTLLVLDGMGVPLYSARGLTQTLSPVQAQSVVRRTINGTARDLSFPAAQKYDSTISCTDLAPPASDGIWAGRVVVVHCVAELTRANAATPSRPVVPGSEIVEGGFTRYRPILTMMITEPPSLSMEEYTANRSWSMKLTEV